MTPAHTTLRELVAHLARAQRAFDAGRIEEADRALRGALAIDPHNVQAADLRQRLAKACQPVVPAASDTIEPPEPAERAGRSRPVTTPLTTRISPAAWSTFEQRVRERRAERAVSEAREALARGDQDAAAAALAELDSVSPHDARRASIAASLAPKEPGHVTVAAATAASPPVGQAAVTPLLVTPRPADLATIPLDHGIPPAAEPRRPAPPVRGRTRSWASAAIACAAIAGSVALSVWLFTPQPGDSLWTTAAPQPPSAEPPRTPVDAGTDINAPEATAPLTGPLDASSELPAGDEAAVVPREPLDGPPGDQVRSADGVPAPAPEADARADAAPPSATVTRATLDGRLSESASVGSTRPPDQPSVTERVEPAPVPLDAPVQSPIAPPDTRPTADPRGGSQAVRTVTPVPDPPAAAPSPAATASRGETETSAVRGVLDGYADAFSTLDANATQRVWPAVDLRGLRRAFDQLTAQTITFNRCVVNASGETAEAVCVGKATWVPKVGDRSPKSEARTWRFALGHDAGEWVIDRVEVQR